MKKIQFSSTSSTNLIAKNLIQEGKCEDQTVIVAKEQTSGKGQYGRVFASPPGGLYFSLILKPGLQSHILPLITLVTGLSCAELLKLSITKPIYLKWPNDVYVGNRKICGILCESIVQGLAKEAWVIIGLGLNVNNKLRDFPEELQTIVTTLHEESGAITNTDVLLDQLIDHITQYIKQLTTNAEELMGKWQLYDYLYDQEIMYETGAKCISGTGLGISPSGGYKFCDAGGRCHEILSGQIQKR